LIFFLYFDIFEDPYVCLDDGWSVLIEENEFEVGDLMRFKFSFYYGNRMVHVLRLLCSSVSTLISSCLSCAPEIVFYWLCVCYICMFVAYDCIFVGCKRCVCIDLAWLNITFRCTSSCIFRFGNFDPCMCIYTFKLFSIFHYML